MTARMLFARKYAHATPHWRSPMYNAKWLGKLYSMAKPLVFDKNAREKYEDYFNAFFADHGEWTKYCSLKDRRLFSSTYQRTRTQMVQDVTVTVKRADLKRKLQADGIIPAEGRYN